MKFSFTLSSLLVLVFWPSIICAQSFTAANKEAISIGEVSINLSLPDNFKNLMADEEIRAMALAGKAPSNELLGVYADPNVVRNAKNSGELIPLSLRVAYMTKMKDRDLSESAISAIRATYEEKTPEIMRPGSKEYNSLMTRLQTSVSQATKGEAKYSVPDVANFGIVASSADHFTAMMLMNVSWDFADGSVSAPYLVTYTNFTVNNRLIFLYVYKRFQTSDDITFVKKFSEDWITRIRADNP
jgi:hypothetical protein